MVSSRRIFVQPRNRRVSEPLLLSSSFYPTSTSSPRAVPFNHITSFVLGLLLVAVLTLQAPSFIRAHENLGGSSASRFDTSLFSTPIFARPAVRSTPSFFSTRVFAFNATDPPPPSDLRVEDQGIGGQLIVRWKLPPAVPVEHVRIYRAAAGGAFGRIGEVGTETFIDRGLQDGQTYTYTVRSVMGSAESTVGPLAAGIPRDLTPPKPPENISTKVGPAGAVEISWTLPDDSDFVGVRIYRSDAPGTLGVRLADGVRESRFIDETAPSGILVFYTVTSVDTSGNESLPPLPPVPIGRANPFSLP